MTEVQSEYAVKPKHDPFDIDSVRAIIGKRVTGVMLKRRKADTRHPDNRMFLMFDDGSGFEFFASGPIFPWEIHRASGYKHIVRRRVQAGQYATIFFDGEPESDEKYIKIESLRKTQRPKPGDDYFDKSYVQEILGRRIRGIRLQSDTHKGLRNNLALIFSDGSVFEFAIAGRLCACSKLESFDLYRLYMRGLNAYENEVLVISDPDGEGVSLVINELYKWPEPIDGGKT